jgi:hypothetical protein
VATTDGASNDATNADSNSGDAASDALQTDTGPGDSSQPDAVGDAGPSQCPVSEPTTGTDCTQNNLKCTYGDAGAAACVCHTVSAGVFKWTCADGPDAAPPACPNGPPPSSGSTCNDAGASFACRFGTTWCFCNEAFNAAPNTWECL